MVRARWLIFHAATMGAIVVSIAGYLAWRGWRNHQPESIDDLTARGIIARMEHAYATCSTYSDTGVVIFDGNPITFKTLYKAPGKIRFEFIDKDPKYPAQGVLWCDGARRLMRFGGIDTPAVWEESYVANSKLSFANDEEHRLRMVIAGFAGISGGAAHTIPTLLYPNDIGGRKPSEMADLVVTGSSLIDRSDCIVLSSKGFGTTLYVDRKSYLIRKVVVVTDGDTDTTSYHPFFGQPTNDRVFQVK